MTDFSEHFPNAAIVLVVQVLPGGPRVDVHVHHGWMQRLTKSQRRTVFAAAQTGLQEVGKQQIPDLPEVPLD